MSRDNRTHYWNVRFHSFSRKHFLATKLFRIVFAGAVAFLVGPYAFSGPITLTRTAPIRDLFSYGFSRKLLAGPYESYVKII